MTSRREELAANLAEVLEAVDPYSPTLIVVTKTYPLSDVEILNQLGANNFGENRSDEGFAKSQAIKAQSKSSNWHYQGEIQSKKIKEILSWADCIHSLDDLRHAEKIDRVLQENSSSINAFLQLSLDGDSSRGGLIESDLFPAAEALNKYRSIDLLGLMCVPPVDMEPALAYAQIASLHQRFSAEFPDSKSLSAGMSGDYMIALDHGATHIRVGSKILGERDYD